MYLLAVPKFVTYEPGCIPLVTQITLVDAAACSIFQAGVSGFHNIVLLGQQFTYTHNMGEPRVAMKELAQRLIVLEEQADLGSIVKKSVAFRVLEKLRILLTRFSGSDGFAALMRRAIALSRSETPSLEGCTLGKDGSIASLEDISAEAGSLLAAQLLDLMTTFIGESLTLRLLADMWPVDTKS